MSVSYNYPECAGEPCGPKIHAGVAASAMTDKRILYCNATHDNGTWDLDVYFEEALGSGDKAILDAIVAASIDSPLPAFHYCASSHMLQDATVTEETNWQELGGTVTTLTSFIHDPTKGWGRITMQVKSTGTGGQLDVVRHSDGVSCMAAPYAVPDTQGAWVNTSFWINKNQPSGIEAFVLNGRRNGATALAVRWVSISLLEKVA